MRKVYINTFAGGQTIETRSNNSKLSQLIQHFDAFSSPNQLTPHRSYVTGDSNQATDQIANFEFYGGILYGNGIRAATSNADVWSASSISTPVWSDISFASSGSPRSVGDLPFFKAYKNFIYGVRGARYVWKFNISNGAVSTSDADLTAYSTVSNGVIHSKDDILYVGYDNKIALNNAGSWTTAALTLPTNCYITSICEYGNYLAIMAASTDIDVQTVVYLWDRDSSLTTISEKVDWGSGTGKILEVVDGILVGIIQFNSGNYFNSRIMGRYWDGGSRAIKFFELYGSSATALATNFKQKFNNRVLFPMGIQIDGMSYYVIAAVGRASSSDGLGINFEYLTANDSSVGQGVNVQLGFILVGDYMYQSYVDNAAAYVMTKTDSDPNYTAISAYQTLINHKMPEEDRLLPKKLYSVSVSNAPLSASQQMVVKYRVDGGSWATILTKTASSPDTDVIAYQTNVPATGQFTGGREFEFRIESTGGAKPTGLIYIYEVTPE